MQLLAATRKVQAEAAALRALAAAGGNGGNGNSNSSSRPATATREKPPVPVVVPKEFLCPISQEIMEDPVTTIDGLTLTLTLTLTPTLALTLSLTLSLTLALTLPLPLTLTRCDEAVTRALVAQLARDVGDGSHPEEIVVAGAADEATNLSPA